MAMGWSVKRRLVYLTIVTVTLLTCGGILWYSRLPQPSCYDNKKNQDELDVDCGGVCAKVCPFEVKPVRELWSRLFQLDRGRYDEVTFIRNPNREFLARDLKYRVRVFDANDVLITTRTGEVYLNPGESLPLYHTRLDVGNRVPKRAVFEITEEPVWQRRSVEEAPVKVGYRSFINEPSPALTAEVSNESLSDLRDITVVGMLADEEENIIAVSSTLVESLGKGEKKEIVFTWPQPLPIEPTFRYFYPHFELPFAN